MPGLRCALAAALVAPLLAPAVAAPNAADAKAIEACLNAAAEKDDLATTCIGIVANPCIAAARGRNSDWEDSKACAARELAVWTARLAVAIRDIQRADRAKAALVSTSQTSWSSSLGKLCPIYDKLDPGTALGGANYCRMQETAMRVLLLERLAVSVNPH